MAGKSNRSATFFAQKKLLGKAHTSNLKTDGEELIGSNVQASTALIFGEAIPNNPARNLYQLQGTPATVEYVQFTLVSIGGTTYDADQSDGGGGSDAGEDAQSAGPHAYKFVLASNYEAQSSNPKEGNGVFDNSKVVHETLGSLQIVPPFFSQASPNPYIVKIYKDNGSGGVGDEIPLLDNIDWNVDTYNGILFVQDYNASKIPAHARAFIYVGDMAKDAAGNFTAGDGLDLSGSEFSLDLKANAGLKIDATELAIEPSDFAGSGLEDSGDTLRIAASAAGAGLTGGAGSALAVNVDDATVEIDTDTVRVKDAGIVTAKLADNAVTTVKITDSNVTNAKLANSAVTIGSTTVSLGATAGALAGVSSITLTGGPTNNLHVATKQYVDQTAQGLSVKDSVRAASTGNVDLATLDAGQALDGVTLAEGDRVLIKNQTTASQNGIYIINADGVAASRAPDMAATSGAAGIFTFVEEGSVNADNGFICTTDDATDTVGTHNLTFVQFSGAGQIDAGAAMSKTGNQLNVEVDDSTIEVSSDALRIKASGVTANEIANNAVGASELADDAVDTNSIVDLNVTTGKLANDAVTAAKLADDAVVTASIVNANVTFAKIQNVAANSLLVRNANSSGVLSELALADTQIMVGDGSGMVAVPLSGDVTMANTGAVTISAGAVETGMIAADAIDGTKIADDAIGSEHIAENAVGSSEIAANAVDTSEIADNAVTADQIAANAVTTAKILDDNVTFSKIQDIAANSMLVRDANSSGAVSELTVASTQIAIGDGNGFTAASLSGDVTMTNAGVVTIANSAVTVAKMANLADMKVLGNVSGDAAAPSAVAILDEDNMASDSATSLVTQQSIKAYVDAQVTAQDLDFQGDAGGALSIDLDSEALTIAGGTGISTSGADNTLTVNIDATVATLTGAQELTNKTLTSPVVNGTVSGTAIKDEDNMASDSASHLATQQSIKAYVDAQVTAQDLDFSTDSGAGAVDLDSQTLAFTSGEGIDITHVDQAVTISGEDATTTNKGVASFSGDNFAVSSGAVTIKDGGVANAELANSSLTIGTTSISLGATSSTLAGLTSVTLTQNPSTNLQAATKQYVDQVSQGLDVKQSARAASTGNVNLATLDAGQSLDGVTLAEGDRVLIKDQTTASENGIYIINADGQAATRSTDMAATTEAAGVFLFVEEGSVNADNGFVCTTNDDADTVGTHNLTFVQFSGAGQITAGDALTKSGNTLNVAVDDSTIEVSGDALRVKDAGVTNAKLQNSGITFARVGGNSTVASLGGTVSFQGSANEVTVGESSGVFTIGLPASVAITTGLTVNGIEATTNTASQTLTNKTLTSAVLNGAISGTSIKDEDDMASDSASHLATQQSIKAYVDAQITAQDLDFSTDSGAGSVDLDSQTMAFTSGEGVDITHSGQTITIAGEDATTSNKGVASFSNDNFAVSSGAVTIKDGGVANAELANSSLTIGGTSISLGGTSATLTGLTSITLTQDPSTDLQTATKRYVDQVAQGLDVKDSVRAASTGNVNLATLDAGQALDGVTLTQGDRVLIKDQSTPSENGIYIINADGNAATRATDMEAGDQAAGIFLFVEEGSVNADNGFVCTTNDAADTVGTHGLTFVQFSGAGQITAGAALTKTGNTLDVAVDDSTIEVSSDALRVKDSGVTLAKLANLADMKVIGNVSGGAGTPAAVSILDEDNLASDSATSLATQQSIKAYVDTQISAQDLDFQGDAGGALSIDLDSETLTLAGGAGVTTTGADNTMTIATDAAQGHVTSVGTLTSLTVAGDVTVDTDTLKVDSTTNRVGIGTTSPGTQLQVEGSNPYLTLKNSTAENTDGGAETKIIFEDHSDTALAQIQASHDGTADDTKGDLIFSTHDGTSLNESLRIDSDGHLTFQKGYISSPSVLVNGTNNPFVGLNWVKFARQDTDFSSGQTSQGIFLLTFVGREGVAERGTRSSYIVTVKFTTSANDPYYLSSGTYLTVDPLDASDLDGFDPTADIAITHENDNTPVYEVWVRSRETHKHLYCTYLGGTNNVDNANYTNLAPIIQTGQVPANSITSLGNIIYGTFATKTYDKVSIGTTDQTEALTVAGNALFDEYLYHNGDTDTFIQFADDAIGITVGGEQLITVTEAGQDIVTIGDGGDVDFRVRTLNDDNTLYIEGSSDRIGIGTNSPSSILHIKEAAPTLTFQRENNSNASTINFIGASGNTANSIIHDSSTNDLVFKTFNGTTVEEIMRIGDHYGTPNRQITLLSGSGMHVGAIQPRECTDIAFFVSGAIGSVGDSSKGASVFGGDLVVSGTSHFKTGLSGSLTRLTDGTSYLVAGTGMSIVTGSSGQLTLSVTSTTPRIKTVYAVTASHPTGTPLTVAGAQISNSDYEPNKSDIYVNGQLMTSGSTRDYTLAGNNTGLNFNFTLEVDDMITVLIT